MLVCVGRLLMRWHFNLIFVHTFVSVIVLSHSSSAFTFPQFPATSDDYYFNISFIYQDILLSAFM